MQITLKHLTTHETKKHSVKRFLIVLVILLIYTIYLVLKFGSDGLSLGIITWSAFVMATPIADAGLLLDLPIRLAAGIRMVYSEMFVWLVAISTNLYFIFFNPEVYHKTSITDAFHQILTKPWPNWIIILISMAGTFLSLYFGDELLDIVFFHQRKKFQKHKHYYYIIIVLFAIILFYFLYHRFLLIFGLNI